MTGKRGICARARKRLLFLCRFKLRPRRSVGHSSFARLTSTTVERDLGRTLANTRASTAIVSVFDRTTSRDARRTRTRTPLLREKPRCSPREAFPVAPPPRGCSETAPPAPVSSPFDASRAHPVARTRRVTPPRARPARRSARRPQVRAPSTPRGSNLFRSARAKYSSSPRASPRTSVDRRRIDPRVGARDRSTLAFTASGRSPTSDSAVPRLRRPSPRAIRRLHLADCEIKRDASPRRRGVRGRRRAVLPRGVRRRRWRPARVQ